jgi:hypothetical protein
MSQVTHIVRKDLRHLRWLLILWGVILTLRVVISSIGAATAGDTFAAVVVLRELSGLLPVLETLMLALIVSRVVHAEPLVGWNAFWITRPYSNRALLTAKLLFLGTALVVAPLAADLLTMAIFGAGPRAQLAASPSFLSSRMSWTLALCAIAVLTPSLSMFVLTLIGVVVGLAVVLLVSISLALTFGAGEATTNASSFVPDPTPGIVSLVLFITGALAVVVYQYRHRRWRVGAAVAAAGLVTTLLLPGFWPWPFLRPMPPDPGRWMDNAQATPVLIDPRFAVDSASRDAFEAGGPLRRRIHARVELTGTPADFAAQSVTVSGTLTLPDGTTLRSTQTESFPRPLDAGVQRTEPTPARAALGGVEILNDIEQRYEQWPVLLSLTETEHARHKGQSGRFDATFDFHLFKTRVRGTLPLRAGAALDDRLSRIELVRALPVGDGYMLVVRHWRAQPLISPEVNPTYEFFLRNRKERSAVSLARGVSWSGSFAGTSIGSRALSAALGGGFSFSSGTSGFTVQTEALEFPSRIRGGIVAGSAKVDKAWFGDAEFVVLETRYAGTVTRSASLPDFQVPLN